MRIGPFLFRPKTIPTLVTLLLLPLLLGLGVWQLDRAEQKREIMRSRASGAEAAVLDLNRAQPGYDEARHRQARLRGRYDPQRQFLLDNQIRNGRAGYHVITPLRLADGSGAVLVDRGWVPAPPRRSRLPDIEITAEMRTVHGQVDDGPGVGIRMGEPAVEARWPRRLAYLDYGYMGSALPYPLLSDYLVQLDPAAPDGYVREWERVEFGPERHVGYAVQWFALALALFLIYLLVNTRRVTHE
ncbi:SURF1 family protein [Ectothiorhodospiraceae bacterium WFHF3C12]|nr:SURF1 family protein [Ectothiorhodospiraceae bacterium WFHF3C12]